MTNSKHANNRIKDVLLLGLDFIQKVNDTTIYAEKVYSPNFAVANKTFCLSLDYKCDNSYLFVNGKEVIKFKAKTQSLTAHLSLGSASANIIKQTENQQDSIDMFMTLA